MSLSKEQNYAIRQMKAGKNISLSGEGGTGKSFAIRRFLDTLSEEERGKTLITAPTGIAAQNIHGITLHSAFGLSTDPYGPDNEPPVKVSEKLEIANRIIIDEISMVRFDIFTYVAKCIHKANQTLDKNIQLIVVGDFYQLPPVLADKDLAALYELWSKGDLKLPSNKNDTDYKLVESEMNKAFLGGYAFQSPMWTSFDFEPIHFTEQHRQADGGIYVDQLNLTRKAVTIEEKEKVLAYFTDPHQISNRKQKDTISIVPINKKADQINFKEIDSLIKSGKKHRTYDAEILGKVSEKPPALDKLTLCKDARVMLTVNDKENNLSNGSTGIVEELDDSYVTVNFNGTSVDIYPYKWTIEDVEVKTRANGSKYLSNVEVGSYTQIPLKPSYAITVHKSQGMTFDRANLHAGCFANGQFYVGASRVTSADGLSIIGTLTTDDIKTSIVVRRFYDSHGTDLNTIIPGPNILQPVLPLLQEEVDTDKDLIEASVPKELEPTTTVASPHTSDEEDKKADLSSLEDLECRLRNLISSHKKKWTAIYLILKQIQEQALFKKSYKNFTEWLTHFAKEVGVTPALLWRHKKAGEVYDTYKSVHPDAPNLETLNISPDNLASAAAIAAGDDELQDSIVGKVLSKEYRRRELKALASKESEKNISTSTNTKSDQDVIINKDKVKKINQIANLVDVNIPEEVAESHSDEIVAAIRDIIEKYTQNKAISP